MIMYTKLSEIFDNYKCEYGCVDFDAQLALLKKYFPIGIIVEVNKNLNSEVFFSHKSKTAIVTGYEKLSRSYVVLVEANEPISTCPETNNIYSYTIRKAYPSTIVYDEEELVAFRNRKIDSLL